MKRVLLVMLFASAAFAQSDRRTSPAQPAAPLPGPLASVVKEVKVKSQAPVLLPTELPQPFAKAKNATIDQASEYRYAISLYYELGVGGSVFAAYFAANARPKYAPKDIGNVREVKLSRGLVGYFRSVSCGGSCAPANLWWEEDRTLYQIQLELSPALSESDQQKTITAVADSAILAGPR